MNTPREMDPMKTRCLVTAGALVLLFAGPAAAQTPVEKGAVVFGAQKCSMCHALDGKGNVKGPLDGAGSKWKAEEIRQWLTDPAGMAIASTARMLCHAAGIARSVGEAP